MGRGTFEDDDIGIFIHAAKHRSQWPWHWNFPACCQPEFWLAGYSSSYVSRQIFPMKNFPVMQPVVKIVWPLVCFPIFITDGNRDFKLVHRLTIARPKCPTCCWQMTPERDIVMAKWSILNVGPHVSGRPKARVISFCIQVLQQVLGRQTTLIWVWLGSCDQFFLDFVAPSCLWKRWS